MVPLGETTEAPSTGRLFIFSLALCSPCLWGKNILARANSVMYKKHMDGEKRFSGGRKKTSQGIGWWFVIIFVLALGYRSLYFLEVRRQLLFRNPVIDAEQHHAWAQRISAGMILGQGPDDVFKPFCYPLLLGGIYALCGPNITVIQWLQFLLGAVSAVLTALVGTILLGKRVGITAGFVSALYAPFLFFEGQLLTPAISIILNLLVTLLLISVAPPWGTIGALGGLAAGVRADVLVALIFVCGYRLWSVSKTEEMRRCLRQVAFLLIGFLLVTIPLLVRNYALTGQWIGFSANAGINFYTGNGPTADGVSAIPPGLAWEQTISTVPEDIFYHPAAVNTLWFARGLHAIINNPLRWLQLLGTKAFAFFNGLEFRNNIGYNWFRSNVSSLGIPFIQYWLVSALAILGMGLCFVKQGHVQERTLLCLWIAGYFLVGLTFFVTARFRLPAVPFMIILASWAGHWLFQKNRLNGKGVGLSGVLVVAALGLTYPGWFDATKGANNWDAINLGNVLRTTGNPQAALAAYEAAARQNPEDPEAYFLAGTTALNLGHPDQAITYLRKAAQRCPTGVDIGLNLGNAYVMQGRLEDAKKCYEDLITFKATTNLVHKRGSVAKAHLGLWQIDRMQGKLDEAERHIESAWNMDEQVVAEYCVINNLELKRSAEVFARLARKEPWNWYPMANLGIAYFKNGQFDQAVGALKKSAELRGALPGVRFYLGLALLQTGKKAEGQAILEKLLAQLPESALRTEIQKVLTPKGIELK
jgi:tetratricopeptide (TPR) repeat protein